MITINLDLPPSPFLYNAFKAACTAQGTSFRKWMLEHYPPIKTSYAASILLGELNETATNRSHRMAMIALMQQQLKELNEKHANLTFGDYLDELEKRAS